MLRYAPLEGVKRENLKITDVRITLLSYELPPVKQWVSARFLAWKRDSILIEGFTDKGIVGIGEPSPQRRPRRGQAVHRRARAAAPDRTKPVRRRAAVRHKEANYTAFKFRMGTEWKPAGMTVQKHIPWVRKLRDAIGPNMDLMLDECLELGPVLEELRFLWFEEPFDLLEEEVSRDPLVVRRGHLDLPNRPGFGVEVAPGLARKFPYVAGSYMKQNPDLP